MMQTISPRYIANTCMCLAVRKAARVIARDYDAALRPIGLTSGQFSILAFISASRPVGVSHLAEELGMDRTTLTAALKPLERDGWISSTVDPKDARGKHYLLTLQGRGKLNTAYPIWVNIQHRVETRLGKGGFDRLHQDIRSLI